MLYRTPAYRVAAVKEAKNALLAARRAVLTTHLNADGDGAGSQAALASWLRANGTEAWIVNPTGYPHSFDFLLEDEDWVVRAGSGRARDLCDTADVAVVLDTGDVARVGRVHDMIRELSTVVIDHHPASDQPIRGLSLIPTMRATRSCWNPSIANWPSLKSTTKSPSTPPDLSLLAPASR